MSKASTVTDCPPVCESHPPLVRESLLAPVRPGFYPASSSGLGRETVSPVGGPTPYLARRYSVTSKAISKPPASSSAAQTAEVSELVELLETQRTHFARLRILADRQKALAVQDDPQPFLTVLAERQRLIDGLIAVNKRLAPYRSRWTSIYLGLDASSRRRVAGLLEESNTTLSNILSGDGRDTATLRVGRQDAVNRESLPAVERA